LSSLNISFFFVQGIPAPPSLSEALERKAESARMVERQVCSLCCPCVDEKVPVCEYKNPNKIMFGDNGKLDATQQVIYIEEQPVSSLLKWYTSGSGTYLTKVCMCVMQS